MIKMLAEFFDRMMRKYTPDPFILALFLSTIILTLSIMITGISFQDTVLFWGDGFWSLMPFTMQMVMIFMGGYILAATSTVSKLLRSIAKRVSSPHKAVLLVSLVSSIGCLLNWGFGLVTASLLCREIIKVMPKANFRLMVAAAYGGFLLFHGGFSGSIPLIIATKGNFSEELIGRLIPISETLFSPLNIFLCIALLIAIPITLWLVSKSEGVQKHTYILKEEEAVVTPLTPSMPAERLESSRLVCLLTGGVGLLYIIIKLSSGTFSLELSNICFILLFTSIFLHKNTKALLKSVDEAVKRVGPIILQFPFYAGITGMLKGSGLASQIASFFSYIAGPSTFDLISFYVAGLLTLFVPSGGGLWVIEAPIVISAAKALGTDIPKTCMAVAWGDAWTHMIQPFWALPVLAIAGLKLRDIMGYCVILLIVSGLIISAGFLLF